MVAGNTTAEHEQFITDRHSMWKKNHQQEIRNNPGYASLSKFEPYEWQFKHSEM